MMTSATRETGFSRPEDNEALNISNSFIWSRTSRVMSTNSQSPKQSYAPKEEVSYDKKQLR